MRTIEIVIPRSWKTLVNTEFPEDLQGMKSGTHREALDDPQPYYDDSRCIIVRDGGVRIAVVLASGQRNYYGTVTVGTWESEPIYNFDQPVDSSSLKVRIVFTT